MIYLIHDFENEIQVSSFSSFEEFVNYIEWQDIFEGKSTISDENGTIYKWDSSKKNEIGTVYGYTLISTGKKYHMIKEIIEQSQLAKNSDEFSFRKNDNGV